MTIDRSAFESLVREHHAAVYRAARNIVRADADAADVTQQVFLHVWRQRATVDPLGAAGHGDELTTSDPGRRLRWLSSRLALNSLRANRRRRRHEKETASMVLSERLHGDPTNDELSTVRGAVDGLDDDLRATVVLRFGEGLTLASIGRIMGCAESTVHGRLNAALEALRRRLSAAGFAGAAGQLDSLLGQGAAVWTAPAVPATLQAKLLAIPAAAGGLGLAKVAVVAVLMAAGAGAAWTLAGAGETHPVPVPAIAVVDAGVAGAPSDAVQPRPQPREAGAAERVVQPRDPGSQDPVPAVHSPAWITGRVRSVDGAPLSGVRVVAHCSELSQKARPYLVATETDEHGAYRLELPIKHRDGLEFRLWLERPDWAGDFDPQRVWLHPGQQRQAFDATMHRWAQDEPGTWSTSVIVSDAAGRPVHDVGVLVFRRMRGDGDDLRIVDETRARTDDRGVAMLQGDHFGDKVLRVAPWGLPLQPREVVVAVRGATPAPWYVELPPDVPLQARVVDARTGESIAGVTVTAERDGRSQAVGRSGSGGIVTLRGLDGGAVSLTGGDQTWSNFCVDGVVPGQEPAVLRLKRLSDPEPVGLSELEIHGRVVDAATGAPLVVEDGSATLMWVREGEQATRESLLCNLVTPWPYQTAAFGDPPPPSSEFHLRAYQEGRCAVVLRTPGRAVAVAGPFDLRRGRLIRDVEIRAETGFRVEVEVVDGEGEAVRGVEVWLGGADEAADRARRERAVELGRATESRQRPAPGRGSRSDEHGRVVFTHVPTRMSWRVHAVDRARRDAGSEQFTGLAQDEVIRCRIVLR